MFKQKFSTEDIIELTDMIKQTKQLNDNLFEIKQILETIQMILIKQFKITKI